MCTWEDNKTISTFLCGGIAFMLKVTQTNFFVEFFVELFCKIWNIVICLHRIKYYTMSNALMLNIKEDKVKM